MKAVRFHEYGDVDVLRVEDVPRPVPGPEEVLVRVAATAFNPVDATLRSGALAEVIPPPFPYTPGMELSGTVVEIGAGVRGHAVGERVIALQPLPAGGGAAEYAVVSTAALAPAPASVPLADAAALPVAALTADQALFELGGRLHGDPGARGRDHPGRPPDQLGGRQPGGDQPPDPSGRRRRPSGKHRPDGVAGRRSSRRALGDLPDPNRRVPPGRSGNGSRQG